MGIFNPENHQDGKENKPQQFHSEVNTEGSSWSNYSADFAVDLWWHDCSPVRRVNQKPRKMYKRHQQSSSTEAHTTGDSESGNDLDLDTWDDLFHNN